MQVFADAAAVDDDLEAAGCVLFVLFVCFGCEAAVFPGAFVVFCGVRAVADCVFRQGWWRVGLHCGCGGRGDGCLCCCRRFVFYCVVAATVKYQSDDYSAEQGAVGSLVGFMASFRCGRSHWCRVAGCNHLFVGYLLIIIFVLCSLVGLCTCMR